MPASSLGRSVVWQPISSRVHGRISVMVMPLPAMLSPSMMGHMMAEFAPQLIQRFGGPFAKNMRITSVATTLCGSSGAIVTMRFRNARMPAEMMLEQRAGVTYMISYTHQGTPVEEHYLRTLCPLPDQDLSSITPPSGWVRTLTLHPIAEWQGPSIGETLVEMRGAAMPNLQAVLGLSKEPLRNVAGIGVTQNYITQTCGSPAIEEDTLIHRGTMQMRTDMIALRGTESSYTLAYTTMGDNLDPSVLAAMHAFCPQ